MKTIRYIETPKELVSMASMVRAQGDESLSLPQGATLDFTETQVQLTNAPGFCLDGKYWDKHRIISHLVELAGMKAKFGQGEDQ